jgi:general secretion pathway protein A
MYVTHFGFIERPFSIAPDPRYLFMSARHREALAHLLYGVREAGGFVLLTGEVGTGKTTVCRALLAQLPADVDVALVLNPRVTSAELLAAICDELRISYPGDASPKILVSALSAYLVDAHARGRRTVLIVDEAQNLRVETLEQIRLLTNLETTREKLLQIVLIGQSELVAMLRRPELRQLAQRITARYHLLPFEERETRLYIRHRVTVGGQSGALFESGALREIHRRSHGIPRLINTICDRALLGAFATDCRGVTPRIARKAADEVLGDGKLRLVRRLVTGAIVATLVVTAGALAAVAGWGTMPGLVALVHLPRGPAARVTPLASPPQPSDANAASGGGLPAAASKPPRLADFLAEPSVPTYRTTAFATLWSLWRLQGDPPHPDAVCAAVRPAGLQCVARSGTWTVLRRLDVPAVLELTAADGAKRYGVLRRLGAGIATLQFGAREISVSVAEIERLWEGPFVALARRPPITTMPLLPGMHGDDVAWLRQRLARAGVRAEGGEALTYDDALQAAVVAFQQRAGLVADGVAGEETLARLMNTGADAISLGTEVR